MEKLTECPMCGSKDIEHRKEDLTRKYHGVQYIAKDIEYVHCNNCQEATLDYNMRKRIESFRPRIKEEV